MNIQKIHSLYFVHGEPLSGSHLKQDGLHPSSSARQCTTAPREYNENRIVTKSEPAKISFSGSFSPTKQAVKKLLEKLGEDGVSPSMRVSAEDGMFDLVEKTRTYLNVDKTSKSKSKVSKFISKVIDQVQGETQTADGEVGKFLNADNNKQSVEALIEKTKEFLKPTYEDAVEKTISNKKIKETINKATDFIHTLENPSKAYTANWLKKFFSQAVTNQNVFQALFALGLTCILRPAAIMALPGQKKNKDDKKYASAHSIASGVIGYVICLIISSPIAKAVKKIGSDPAKYLSEKAKYLGDFKSEKFSSKSAFKAAQTMINMGHEMFIAPGRAIITVALIPPVLKYVFGMEKGGNKKAPENVHLAQKMDKPLPKSFASFEGGNK
jgi:hypothetical protein